MDKGRSSTWEATKRQILLGNLRSQLNYTISSVVVGVILGVGAYFHNPSIFNVANMKFEQTKLFLACGLIFMMALTYVLKFFEKYYKKLNIARLYIGINIMPRIFLVLKPLGVTAAGTFFVTLFTGESDLSILIFLYTPLLFSEYMYDLEDYFTCKEIKIYVVGNGGS